MTFEMYNLIYKYKKLKKIKKIVFISKYIK